MEDSAEPLTATGGCLCGAVRFALHGRLPPVGMCHCSLCRRVSGAGSNAVLNVRADRFEWLAGQSHWREFRTPSGWGSFFCPTCGSPAPHLLSNGERYLVPAGSLDADPGPRVAGHIFVGSKVSWDVIGGDAAQFEAWPESGT
ncbi:MAG: GFA family protein [Phenylobacterium sp.]